MVLHGTYATILDKGYNLYSDNLVNMILLLFYFVARVLEDEILLKLAIYR